MSNFLTETEMDAAFLKLVPVDVSATATLAAWNGEKTWLVDTSGGAVALTLPDSLACRNGSQAVFVLAVAGNDLTITPGSGDVINGSAASVTLSTQYATLTLIRRRTGWIIGTGVTP